MPRVGLALGGGGAKGFAHIPVFHVFDEMQITPSVIAGTSIGAMLGAYYAAGMSGSQIRKELEKLRLRDVSSILDIRLRGGTGLFKGQGLKEFLKKTLPCSRFEELSIPMKIVAADFWERKEVVFERGNLIQAIRASTAMPSIFEPVSENGAVLVDGGVINPLPYDLIADECDILVAVDVSGTRTPSRDTNIPGMMDGMLNVLQIMQSSIIASKGLAHKVDVYFKPQLTDVRVLEFYRHDEILEGIDREIGAFKKELERVLGG